MGRKEHENIVMKSLSANINAINRDSCGGCVSDLKIETKIDDWQLLK